ncbi:MAG: alpha-L-fucosidase [Clostridiales bacterium]|nr:alpha-L-fucosidase [Clostridiales bacterium]
MKKKKILSFLLAGVMIGQTVPIGTMIVSAEEKSMVGEEQLSDKKTAAPEKDKAVPNNSQYKYQKDELAAFCHFGPNTFTGKEWGDNYGDTDPNQLFTLKENFDAETLVKTIKEAGFKKLIITAKHHDGFCLWNSEYTTYDVGSTDYAKKNYDNMGGDILAEISAACTKENIDMGLYLSPWDIHEPSYGNNSPGDYNEFYNNQLKEILGNNKYGNNGKFVEIWMDGAKGGGADPQDYTIDKWYETITKYEGEECLIFGAGPYASVRWIGNENGEAADETWSKSILTEDNKIKNDPSQREDDFKGDPTDHFSNGYAEGNKWTVPEVDARITSGWFWGNGKSTPKSMEQLANMYFSSVGRNAPLLLNIPPNNKGTVDDAILNRVKEFGNAVKETFTNNIAAGENVSCTASEVRGNDIAYSPNNVLDGNQDTYWTTDDKTVATEATLEMNLGETKQFDVVSIEEAIKFGQRISEFRVEYKNGSDEWKVFGSGKTVGAKRLCRKSPVKADKLRITVKTSEKAEHKAPIISEVGVYRAAADFALGNGIPEGLEIIEDTNSKFTFKGSWGNDTGEAYTGGTGRWANPGNGTEATVKFKGTKVWLLGTVDPNHGTADVYIDDKLVKTIDTHGSSRKLQQRIFESDTLANGEHTLKIVPKNKATGIDAALVLDNEEKGMFDFEVSSFEVNEESKAEFTVKRLGGSKSEAKVNYAVNPGSAIQDHFDADAKGTLTFAEGETEKKFEVQIKTVDVDNLSFTVELNTPTEGTITGFNTPARVVIRDGKTEDKGNYGENNRFQFPSKKDASAILEAELMQLTNNTEGDNNWPLQVTEEPTASNGKFLNCLNSNDQAKLYYNAPKAGTYTVTVRYRSGDAQNGFKWTEANGKVEAGNVTAGASDNAAAYHEKTFEMKVLTPGEGVLTFVGAEGHNAPQLDKFDIAAKEVQTVEYNVTKTAGENGTITGPDKIEAGTDATFTITPNEGYRVADVKINGTSVGAVTTYTVKNVAADVKIEATFAAEDFKYTEKNPFEFPAKKDEVKTLEAEYATELINSTDADSDPDWPLEIAKEAWASNGKYVNCLAFKDYIKYTYTAAAGKYEVKLTYRSGSDTNKLAWAEKDGNVAAGQTAVANTNVNDSLQVNTTTFELDVKKDGAGLLSFTAPDTGKGPQIDKFEIKRISETEPEPEKVDKSQLNAVIKDAEGKDLGNYEDGAEKEAFKKALEAAKVVVGNEKATQAEVDNAKTVVQNAMDALVEKAPVKPEQVDKATLQAYYDKCTASYKEADYTKESWKEYAEALKTAETVLAKEDATQKDVDQVKADLEKAVQSLKKEVDDKKPVDNKKPATGNETTTQSKAPTTGDPAATMLWLATAASSLAVLGKKKNKED